MLKSFEKMSRNTLATPLPLVTLSRTTDSCIVNELSNPQSLKYTSAREH
jgi:hypothetical protein